MCLLKENALISNAILLIESFEGFCTGQKEELGTAVVKTFFIWVLAMLLCYALSDKVWFTFSFGSQLKNKTGSDFKLCTCFINLILIENLKVLF